MKNVHHDVVSEGSHHNFFCFVSSGSLPLKFQWLKDGQVINKLQKDIQIVSVDEMSSKLSIKKTTSNDSGNYTCSVQNHVGIDSHTFKLTVKGICICKLRLN